jgi:hypothetical protein
MNRMSVLVTKRAFHVEVGFIKRALRQKSISSKERDNERAIHRQSMSSAEDITKRGFHRKRTSSKDSSKELSIKRAFDLPMHW